MKWVSFFCIGLIIGFGYLVSQSLEKERAFQNKMNNEAAIIEKNKTQLFFNKCNYFPEDGYLKTDSGYYFDLFKFIQFIKKEQPEFEDEAKKNPYQALWRYFKFKLNKNNECVLINFNKILFWDMGNKQFKNVKDIVDRDLLNQITNIKYDAVNYKKTIKKFNAQLNKVGASFSLMSVKKPEELIKMSQQKWSIERRPYVLLPLINYPDIKVLLTDQEVGQGFVNTDILQPDRVFVFEGINNFGVDYTFQCNQMMWTLSKQKKLYLNKLLNISAPIKNSRCTATRGNNNDTLYREYGGVSLDINTNDFHNLKPILEQSTKFVDQFIIKEKIRGNTYLMKVRDN